MARTKPKYNAKPTEREKQFHLWLMAEVSCACGCGQASTVVHHPLKRHPDQRWRRDHEFVVPMNAQCHFDLHQQGSEDFDAAERANWYRAMGYNRGKL